VRRGARSQADVVRRDRSCSRSERHRANPSRILPASCTSSCFMLMIWSSRARKRSLDPVVSCFFGRIVPSDAAQITPGDSSVSQK
jgi:hypothetical protein